MRGLSSEGSQQQASYQSLFWLVQGLDMLSDYDYIAIFDADFKPEPDFLVRIMAGHKCNSNTWGRCSTGAARRTFFGMCCPPHLADCLFAVVPP